MKVLFDHPLPFLLAHGGFQTQIEQTKAALEQIGVQVEHLRWWDDSQRVDIIHYFGRPSEAYVQLAHDKGIKVILGDLLSGLAARSTAARKAQKAIIALAEKVLPPTFRTRMAWNSVRWADASIALTSWEGKLMTEVFGVDPARVHVVPNGVESPFFESKPATRGPWLVCTATITERKRVVELAEAAALAKTPLWIIGKPYGPDDPYARRFFQLAKANASIIRYEGAVQDRQKLAQIYREARGFVLLSAVESLSLSALEAAACECPLLLSDLPWARCVFQEHSSYCPVPAPASQTAGVLRRFYDDAPKLPIAPKPPTWREVGSMMKAVYERVLSTSR